MIEGGAYYFPECHSVTAEDLMSKITVVDKDGNEMPEMLNLIRFSNGGAIQHLMPEEVADFINSQISDLGMKIGAFLVYM